MYIITLQAWNLEYLKNWKSGYKGISRIKHEVTGKTVKEAMRNVNAVIDTHDLSMYEPLQITNIINTEEEN